MCFIYCIRLVSRIVFFIYDGTPHCLPLPDIVAIAKVIIHTFINNFNQYYQQLLVNDNRGLLSLSVYCLDYHPMFYFFLAVVFCAQHCCRIRCEHINCLSNNTYFFMN